MGDFLRRILFLPPESSTVARSVDHLHFFVILTTMAGAVFITVVGGLFLVRYRSSRRPYEEAVPHTQSVRAPAWVEATVVVGLLSLFFLWWGIGVHLYEHLRVAPAGSMQIYVTAKQWMWQFGYPEGGHSIATLYVPAGRPIELDMTSRDVIHSFFVPDFRIKQDVVPGRYTTVWFEADEPGTHDIYCTQYCGTGHSKMRGQVVVLTPADFEGWLAGANPPPPGPQDQQPAVVTDFPLPQLTEMARQGLRVAGVHGCLRCHTLDGTPHIGPTWAGLYGSTVPLEDGGSVTADDAYITESMMDPFAKIHAGFRALMPTYQGLIAPGDTAAIIELIKSLRDVTRAPQVQMFVPAPGVPASRPASLPTGTAPPAWMTPIPVPPPPSAPADVHPGGRR
jgi:cytochrome c oxidase subunit 2